MLGPALALLFFICVLPRIVDAAVAPGGNIDPDNDGSHFAYGENIGWINFKPAFGDGVTVTGAAVTGYAWGENIGWINLSPTDGGVINDGLGHLSGFAWGENMGWINFAPMGAGVTINGATGTFGGFAWGENIGWINLVPTGGGGVSTSWRAPATTNLLAVTKNGTGTGAVTSSPAGINCGGVCSHHFPGNNSATLTAAAGADSFFTGWSGGGCSGTGPCTLTMNADKSVAATFTHNPVTLTVNRTGAEAGTVLSASPSTAITCGSACSATFAYGTMVTLTALPFPGAVFNGWTGCDGTSGTTCTLTMNGPKTVTASFAYWLLVTEAGTGSGTVSSSSGIFCAGNTGTCSMIPAIGTSVTLTASPTFGSAFAGWVGEGCSGAGNCIVPMTMTRNVMAVFNAVPPPPSYTLTVTKVGSGTGTIVSVSPSAAINCGAVCSALFDQGATVFLTATPDAGASFGGWSGPCTGTGTCAVTLNGPQTVTVTFNPVVAAPTYQVLHAFASPDVSPHRLIQGTDGNLYGTTQAGGANGTGSVFRLSPDGLSFLELFSFPASTGFPDPTYYTPSSGLLQGKDGLLYGTTEFGGPNGGTGSGAIFRLNTNGTGFGVLHWFDGFSEGYAPHGGLLQANDGLLYGTTAMGGAYGYGTIYKLSPDGSGFTVLHPFSFTSAEGMNPYSGLLQGSDLALYGIAKGGGTFGKGTVFKLNLDGTSFTVLHSFDWTFGDAYTYGGLIQGSGDTIYGTTGTGGASGYGAVFKLQPDGSGFAVLHAFDGFNEGANPYGGVILGTDGTLYGTTQQAGHFGHGTLYALKPDGTGFTVLSEFNTGSDGFYPWAGLLQGSDNALYGTTTTAGSAGGGVVFRLAGAFSLNFPLSVATAGSGTGNVTSAPTSINCPVVCSGSFSSTTTVALTATPNFGFAFTGWSGACTGTGVCTLTMDAVKNVTATFNLVPPPSTYSLSVSPPAPGTGTVTSSPAGISCGVTCSAGFSAGSSVTLIAAAGSGSVFTGWTACDIPSGTTCTLTMNGPKSVQAGFLSVGTQSLNVEKAGTGTVSSSPAGITCGSTCSAPFTFGTSVTLTAAPASGFTFAGWSGEGCSGTGTCAVSITVARHVTANFQDSVPPTIAHTAVWSWALNTNLPISATVTDNVGVQGVTLFYGSSVTTSFTAVPMTATGATYRATIPGSAVTRAGVDYYLEARDTTNNLTRAPSTAPGTRYFVYVGTTVFTDDPLIPGTTPIKAVHFTQLRTAINALRARYSLLAFAWTGTAPAPGGTVSGAHLTDLRTALTQAYLAAGRSAPPYTDFALVAGTPIKTSHLDELRMYVRLLE